MHRKLVKFGYAVLEKHACEETDRQTDRQTLLSQYFASPTTGGVTVDPYVRDENKNINNVFIRQRQKNFSNVWNNSGWIVINRILACMCLYLCFLFALTLVNTRHDERTLFATSRRTVWL